MDVSSSRGSRLMLGALVESFVVLASEKGAGAFGVAEVARKAGVNRSTFYRHFENIGDFRDRGLMLLFYEFAKEYPAAAPHEEDCWRSSAVKRVTRFLEQLRSRASFFRMILNGSAGGTVLQQVSGFLYSFFLNERILPGHALYRFPHALTARCLSGLLQGFALWSLDHPYEDAEKSAEQFIALVETGFLDGEGPDADSESSRSRSW